MSVHRINIFNFEFWHGSPPVLVSERIASHTRPGADGVGQQKLGRWAPAFESTLVGHYASYATAIQAHALMIAIVGTGPVEVVYNAINYKLVFRHLYLVDAVSMAECKRKVRLIGPGYDYLGGAELTVRFTLTPLRIF